MTGTVSETVRETATGYLVTRVTRTAGGAHEVHRSAGTARPPRAEPDDELLAEVARAVGPASVASPGRRTGTGWRHRVPGPASLALLLSAGMRAEPLLDLAHALGEALAQVHRRAPRRTLSEPSGLTRLRAWPAVSTGPTRRALDTTAEALGPGGLPALLADLDTLRVPVTLLGSPGTQTLYPDPDGGPPTVLVTDELASGPAEWDLGWVVGELLERSLGSPGDGEPLARAARGVLAAYTGAGGTTDPRHVAAAATARVLVHVHDYAAYVGWHESLPDRTHAVGRWRTDPDLVGRWCTAG